MKSKQLRLLIFVWIIGMAIKVLPKDAIKTYEWITKIPFEE